MTSGSAARRRIVVREARVALAEACGTIDRLTESLDPRLPEAAADFSYARGLLQHATDVMRELDEHLNEATGPPPADLPRIVGGTGPEPQEVVRLGWFG